MTRYRSSVLVVTVSVVAGGALACGGQTNGGKQGAAGAAGAGGGDGGGGGGAAGDSGGRAAAGDDGGRVAIDDSCEGACCPTVGACYSDPALGRHAPGAECLATQDNTGKKRIQMRQQWVRPPVRGESPIEYGVLYGRTQLPWKDCNQGYSSFGVGGYIELLDFNFEDPDESKHVAHVGYARYVPESGLMDVLTNGLCYAQERYAGDPAYRLGADEMTPWGDFPPGLPRPMPLKDAAGASTPWTVKPTRAKRLLQDFALPAERERLLAMFDPGNPDNISKDGFDGVFYYDEQTGKSHGFSALSWTIVYGSDGTTHLSIPFREVETKSQQNNPESPNCVGAYRAEALDPTTSPPCTSYAPDRPPWGCKDDACPTGTTRKDGSQVTAAQSVGAGPATTNGYVLITELEQLYSPDLRVTLCVSYPTQTAMETAGFYNPDTKSCRSAKWNPTAPGNAGIPQGDWCAATNSPATATCHDAWQRYSFHVYSGAKVRVDAATREPTYCAL